jgi:hypothetical protein
LTDRSRQVKDRFPPGPATIKGPALGLFPRPGLWLRQRVPGAALAALAALGLALGLPGNILSAFGPGIPPIFRASGRIYVQKAKAAKMDRSSLQGLRP